MARFHGAGLASGRPPLIRTASKTAWLTIAGGLPATSRRRAARSVVRYWRWQLGRRVRGGDLELELNPQKVRLRVPACSQIGGMIVANGSHEPSETWLFTRTLKPGDVFYGVGANIGLCTLLAADGARVVAFEPDGRAGQSLRRNVALAGVGDRIEVRVVALADFDGEASFTTGLEVGNHLLARAVTGDTATVTVSRLDTLAAFSRLPLPPPGSLTFLKVDAEGHDLEVLHGAKALLRQHSPVVMVETWAGGG